MLKKLLKYDLKFIFKYWWIAAVVTIGASVLAGFCMRLLDYSDNRRELPALVLSSASSMITLTIVVFIAFSILSTILIFIRFYSNFFSDEGYLTFTLPVKRSSLITSKIISASFTQIATSFLIVFGVCLMFIIAFWENFWSKEFWAGLGEILEYYFKDNTFYRIMYILEAIALYVTSIAFSTMFLFTCITFASIITKKARVITAIGIYFGINMLVSFVIQIFALFGISTLVGYFKNLSSSIIEPVICLTLFVGVLFFVIIAFALYTLHYYMLDRKLNLT